MERNLISLLEKLGLSKNEIKVYETALRLGQSKIAEVAGAAQVHRVAAYSLVDTLLARGLLTEIDTKHGRLISANHPRYLLELVKDQQRQLKKMELKYEELLPDLLALYRTSTVRPQVQFFEGIKGLEQINKDIIQSLSELPLKERVTLSYSNPNLVGQRFEGYVSEEGGYIDRRKEFQIRNRAIALDGPLTQEISERDEEELREMIILPPKLFPYKNDITLYGNKMAIQALERELIGVVIESQEIVNDQRAIFELAWTGAKTIVGKKV